MIQRALCLMPISGTVDGFAVLKPRTTKGVVQDAGVIWNRLNPHKHVPLLRKRPDISVLEPSELVQMQP